MRRIITGATGLIGRNLVDRWLGQGHTIIVIGRNKQTIEDIFGKKVQAVTWLELKSEIFESVDVVVNLAGANIGEKPWGDTRKLEILSSRIDTTKQIAELLASLGKDAPPLFNASAIGIYGLQKQLAKGLPAPLDEDKKIDWEHPSDFLSEIGSKWEQAANAALEKHLRVVFLRFGIVLAKEGGALPQLVKPFKMFLGGALGTGKQPISWVALPDVIRAIDFLLAKPKTSGPYNIVAPHAVTEQQLAKTIGEVLHKPAALKMPAFALKLLLGKEMARELLLEGQHVYPKRLLELGFEFKYPTIDSALRYILL